MIRGKLLPLLMAGFMTFSGLASDVLVYAETTETQNEMTIDTELSDEISDEQENTSDSNDDSQGTTNEENVDSVDTTNATINAAPLESGTMDAPITSADALYAAIDNAGGSQAEPVEIYVKSMSYDSGYAPISLNKPIVLGSEAEEKFVKIVALDQTIIGRGETEDGAYKGNLFEIYNGSLEFDTINNASFMIDGTNATDNKEPSVGSLVLLNGENTKLIINDRVALTNNFSQVHGGAIFNIGGTVVLNGGIITNNQIMYYTTKPTYGGAIMTSGKVCVNNDAVVMGNSRITTTGNVINDNISVNYVKIEGGYDSGIEIIGNLTGDGRQLGVSVCLETGDVSKPIITAADGVDLASNIKGKIKYDFDSRYTEKNGKLSIVTDDIQPYGLRNDGTLYKAPMLNNGTSLNDAEISKPEWANRSSVTLKGRFDCAAPCTIYAVPKEHATGIEDTISLSELINSEIKGDVDQNAKTYTVQLDNLDPNKNYTVFFLAQSEDGALSVTAKFDYSKLNEGRPTQEEEELSALATRLKAGEALLSISLIKEEITPTPTPTPGVDPEPVAIAGAKFSLLDQDGKPVTEKKEGKDVPIEWVSTSDLSKKWEIPSTLKTGVYGIREDAYANGLIINPDDTIIYFNYDSSKPELKFTDKTGETEVVYPNVIYDKETADMKISNTDTQMTFLRKTYESKDAKNATLTIKPVKDQNSKAVAPVLDKDGKEVDNNIILTDKDSGSNLTDGIYSVTSTVPSLDSAMGPCDTIPEFFFKLSKGDVFLCDQDGKKIERNDVVCDNTAILITYPEKKYNISLRKLGSDKQPLKGAEFSIVGYRDTISGRKKLTSTWDTSVKNPYTLKFYTGTYTFKETKAPNGYAKMDTFKVIVAKDGTISTDHATVKIDKNVITITNAVATPTPKVTATPTPVPKHPKVKESTMSGLETPKKFYPKVLYPFTVKGAGVDNDDPNEGDWKWYPFYWSTKKSDLPADDYENEQPIQNWKIGNKKGIKESKTFNLYVWFRRYIYEDGDWTRDTSEYGKQRAVFQFKSDGNIDKKVWDDALSGTPVPESELSDGGYNGGDDMDGGSGSGSSSKKSKDDKKSKGAKTADNTPIAPMMILIVAAFALISGVLVIKKRRN